MPSPKRGVEPLTRDGRDVKPPSRVSCQPPAHDWRTVQRDGVEDGMDDLAGGDLALEVVEQTDELLMPVPRHVSPCDGALEQVERSEARRRAIAPALMGPCSGATLLHRQSRLDAVERLDPGLPPAPKARWQGPAGRREGQRPRPASRRTPDPAGARRFATGGERGRSTGGPSTGKPAFPSRPCRSSGLSRRQVRPKARLRPGDHRGQRPELRFLPP